MAKKIDDGGCVKLMIHPLDRVESQDQFSRED